MSWRRTVWAVGRREYLQRVRSKFFVTATLGLPLLVILLAALSGFLAARTVAGSDDLVVVDRTGLLVEELLPVLEQLGFRPRMGDPDALDEELRSGVRDGGPPVVVLDEASLSRGRILYLSRNPPSPLRGLGIRQAVSGLALDRRFSDDEGQRELRALLEGGELEFGSVGEDGEDGGRASSLILGAAGGFLLYFALVVYGSMILRSVMEERANRVVEILVSAIRPWELMLGKILGVGVVGLTQLGIWIALSGVLLLAAIPGFGEALPEGGVLGELELAPPETAVLLYFGIAFVLGYFLYAGLFAVVGALCSTEEEAQQAQLPVILLVVVPVLFLLPVLEEPGSGLARGLSLIPFFTPILMFARVAVGGAAGWEVSLSIILMSAAVGAVAWVAGKVYRTGLLMRGKRPTVRELWRWIRA